jgi:hypothetical protein
MARRRAGQPPTAADVSELRAMSARSMAAVEQVLTAEQRAQWERNRSRGRPVFSPDAPPAGTATLRSKP